METKFTEGVFFSLQTFLKTTQSAASIQAEVVQLPVSETFSDGERVFVFSGGNCYDTLPERLCYLGHNFPPLIYSSFSFWVNTQSAGEGTCASQWVFICPVLE